VAGETLQPIHVDDCLEHDDIALVVGDRAGGRIEPVDEEGRHLHFGKGAPHAIAVENGQAGVSSGEHRLDRVRAPDLGRDQRGHADPGRFLDAAQRAQAFLALLDFLDPDDRRANAADRTDVIVVADRLERHNLDLRLCATIRVSAACRCKDCRRRRSRRARRRAKEEADRFQ